MEWKDVKKLVAKKESATLEFKPSLSDVDRIVEVVCSFANSKGGIVLVGVSDKGGIAGVDIGRQTVEGLSNKLFEKKLIQKKERKRGHIMNYFDYGTFMGHRISQKAIGTIMVSRKECWSRKEKAEPCDMSPGND